MKKISLLIILLCGLLQIHAQNNEVEIYIVHSDSILKGTVLSNSSDSIILQTDSVTFVSFSKNDLEGRDLAVSKEIKKLKKRLLRKEQSVTSSFSDNVPGSYQIKHGQKTKGYIMAGLAVVSIAGALVVTPVWVIVSGLKGLILLVGIVDGIVGSIALYGISTIWSKTDQYFTAKKIVNNRYYYTGNKF